MGIEPDEAVIVRRLGALNLVQSMYDCLSPTVIRTKLNPIFYPNNGKGNELTTEVMKAAHTIKSENVCCGYNPKTYLRRQITPKFLPL